MLRTSLCSDVQHLQQVQGVVGCGDQALMVGKLIEKVAALERTLLDAEKVRRQLHNDLVEIRGNIRVFARIRPCDRPPVAEATASDSLRLMVDAKPNDFYFDRYAATCAAHSPSSTRAAQRNRFYYAVVHTVSLL